jgi:PAS domain S-box-containing protein
MTEAWAEEMPATVIVIDASGTIVSLNARAREAYAKEGGAALVGQSIFDCHPEHARDKLRALLATRTANHYTIRKKGQRKIIHQMPWYRGGEFAGLVELSIPIPDDLPHFERG